MTRRAKQLLLLLPLALAACGASAATIRRTALQRATFDLNCPAEQLTATQVGDTTSVGPWGGELERAVMGVSGCGQKAVYVVECTGSNTCNALLNADTERAAQP